MKWPDGDKVWRGAEALKGAGQGVAGTTGGGSGGGASTSYQPCREPLCLIDGLHAHLPGGVTVAGGGRGRSSTSTAGGAGGGGAGYPVGGRTLTPDEYSELIRSLPSIPQGPPAEPGPPAAPERLSEDLQALAGHLMVIRDQLDLLAIRPPRELPSGDVLGYLSRCDCGTQALTREQHRVWRCEQCEATGDGFERNTIGVRVPEADARAWAAINEEAQRRGRALWADPGHAATRAAAEEALANYAAAEGLDPDAEPEPAPVDTHELRNGFNELLRTRHTCGRCGRPCGPEGHAVCSA